jgi:hypothetical protein
MITEKIKNLWQTNMQGGITTYIMLLFGMSIMLHMFGFKSFLDGYFRTATLGTNGTLITNPDLISASNPLELLLTILQSNAGLAIGAGLLVSVISLIGCRLILGSSTTSTIISYAIPIVFLVAFLNLFVFPISTMQADLQSFDIAGLPASLGLFAFFNLFLILAILDFVRGGQT